MIIDTLENARLYYKLGGGIRAALEYLEKTDFSKIAPARYEIDNDRLYALVQEYETKPKAHGVWEAHRRHIDVQYVAEGVETMGCAHIGNLTVRQEYSHEKDYELLSGKGDFFTARAGMFVVFFPHDAHMPSLARGAPAKVKKAVVKVLKE